MLFGQRNEDRRRDRAMLRMIPAQQRLEHLDLGGHGINHRLIDDIDLAGFGSFAQVGNQLRSVSGCGVEAAGEEAETAAGFLGGIKRHVGGAGEFAGIKAIIRRNRNADRGPDIRPLAADLIGLRQFVHDPLGKIGQGAAIIHIGQQDLELIAAQPPDLAALAEDRHQPPRHLLEQIIPGVVPHCVIDLLEAVEIKHHQRAAALCLPEGGENGAKPLANPAAVGKPGQFIDLRLERGLHFLKILRGNIDRAAAIAQEPALAVVQRAAGEAPPA